MQPMKSFLDTQDQKHRTYPAGLTPGQFEAFFAQYEQPCYAEGGSAAASPCRLHCRAWLLAPDAGAVHLAHARGGLPFDSITEVTTTTLNDNLFRRPTV